MRSRSARFLARPDVKASAHLVIGRKGEIIQLVPFDVEAWHAGQSSYAGRTHLNRFSIGIELDNLGRLVWTAGRFVAECGIEVEPEQVFADVSGGTATYWHRYTGQQKENIAGGMWAAESSTIRFVMSSVTRTLPAVNRTSVLNCTDLCASNSYVKL